MNQQYFMIYDKKEEISSNTVRVTVIMKISLCTHHEEQEHTLRRLVRKFGHQMVNISTKYAIFGHVPKAMIGSEIHLLN